MWFEEFWESIKGITIIAIGITIIIVAISIGIKIGHWIIQL